MAFIKRIPAAEIDPTDRINDRDNILQVHSVHSRVMKLHYDLYLQIMHREGPLSRFQRELVAVAVSAINECDY